MNGRQQTMDIARSHCVLNLWIPRVFFLFFPGYATYVNILFCLHLRLTFLKWVPPSDNSDI